MSDYDFKGSKARAFAILDNKTEVARKDCVPSDAAFNFENGIKAPVASIFVDIRKSTELFKKNHRDRVARMVRTFISETVRILRSDDNFRDLGIRGDCVFAVYSASSKEDIKSIFNRASLVNTFLRMLNIFLENKKWPLIKIGIGLGYDPDELVIKTGEKGSGFNDFVWIGNAVIDASNCCGIANKGRVNSIVASSMFYDKLKDQKANKKYVYSDYFKRKYSQEVGGIVYDCDLVNSAFNDWINEGMKK